MRQPEPVNPSRLFPLSTAPSVLLCAAISSTLFSPVAHADPAEDLAKEKAASAAYVAQMAKEPAAQVIEEGVVIRPIFVSDSKTFPQVSQTVKVAYLLADREGKLVEESLSSDALAAFPLAKLIRCWQIAVPKMSIGSLYKVTCPSDVAYGDKGAGGGEIKPGAALTFRISLYAAE